MMFYCLQMYFVHSSTEGQLCCFFLLVIIHNTACYDICVRAVVEMFSFPKYTLEGQREPSFFLLVVKPPPTEFLASIQNALPPDSL